MSETESFDQAEIYIKEALSIPIEMAVKELNKQLINDSVVPGLKLITTGGQAIQKYFPDSSYLKTHDYDLKLIAPKTTTYDDVTKDRMILLGRGITRYLEISLNRYIDNILDKISSEVKDRYGLELLKDENNKVFTASTNLRNQSLNILTFKLKSPVKIRRNSISDVYVVDPEEIYHYNTFTGLSSDSNPILSEDAGNYYIPHQEVNGIPVAALGYLIWDTLRMVDVSEELGLAKAPRYKEKRDAIFKGLNTPQKDLSCNSMKDYML